MRARSLNLSLLAQVVQLFRQVTLKALSYVPVPLLLSVGLDVHTSTTSLLAERRASVGGSGPPRAGGEVQRVVHIPLAVTRELLRL